MLIERSREYAKCRSTLVQRWMSYARKDVFTDPYSCAARRTPIGSRTRHVTSCHIAGAHDTSWDQNRGSTREQLPILPTVLPCDLSLLYDRFTEYFKGASLSTGTCKQLLDTSCRVWSKQKRGQTVLRWFAREGFLVERAIDDKMNQ